MKNLATGVSTASTAPLEQKLARSWVRFLLGTGFILFSLSFIGAFFIRYLKEVQLY